MTTIRFILLITFTFLVGSLLFMGNGYSAELNTYASSSLGNYVVLGWNDLGMHCMGKNYGDICILPPFNNMWAQVIKRGNPPQLVSSGVNLSYRYPANSNSTSKIDFWTYSYSIFSVTLAPNVGLTGNGLSGNMSWNGTAYEASGVPLAGWDDGSTVEQPYQLAEVTLTFTTSTLILDKTTFVTPVSTEMNCAKCHSSGTTNVYQNILKKHDNENGTLLMNARPVLCANCHASNALGKPGKPGLPSLSKAMHKFHGEEVSTISCYDCHPGQTTKCLRGAMYIHGKTCTDCHGSILQVATSQDTGRRAWLDEPKCGTCHTAFPENTNTLYRNSTGHASLYCESCHNSTHAELPTVQARDSVQVQRVQGTSSYIKDCMVCHTVQPTAAGPHGFVNVTYSGFATE